MKNETCSARSRLLRVIQTSRPSWKMQVRVMMKSNVFVQLCQYRLKSSIQQKITQIFIQYEFRCRFSVVYYTSSVKTTPTAHSITLIIWFISSNQISRCVAATKSLHSFGPCLCGIKEKCFFFTFLDLTFLRISRPVYRC